MPFKIITILIGQNTHCMYSGSVVCVVCIVCGIIKVHICVCRLQYSSASTETDKREDDNPSSS